jgi:hypothetical protein
MVCRSPVIKESTDKTGMMILRGVPATILDKQTGNGRRYTTKEMRRSTRKARESGLFENRRLLVRLMIIRKNRSLLLLMLHMLLSMLILRQSAEMSY